jgi:hypothetical protein
MNKTIGIIIFLAISPSIFADDIQAAPAASAPLIESDVAVESTPAPVMMKEQSGFSRGSVVRSAFTRDISEREPTEDLQRLTNDNEQVKFFTELRDMSGQTAIHRWQYDGKVVAEIEFNVKGPRWRVWSSKSFVPQWTGDWKVSVVNGAGEVISEKNLNYDIASVQDAPKDETPATSPNTMQ